MLPQLQIQRTSIVVRGVFSPALFHPSWFESHSLIRPQEAEAAQVEIVSPGVAVFTAEWLHIQVMEDRFHAATTDESSYEPLRDLVVGVLDLLSHTSLRAMGLNREFHYWFQSKDAQNQVGHRLAPKQDWEDVLAAPGMASLSMQGKRPDDLEGYIQVKVEPSHRVEPGVFVEVNDHFQLDSKGTDPSATGEAVRILSQLWRESMERSLAIARKVASLGELR